MTPINSVWTHGCDACGASARVEYVPPIGYLCVFCQRPESIADLRREIQQSTPDRFDEMARRVLLDIASSKEKVEIVADALRAAHSTGIDEGRSRGRADIGKYSNAIGKIESALGIVGAKPLSETVAAVERFVAFANDCATNWDCDTDAHRHRTTCRKCDAETLVATAQKVKP